MNTAVQTYIDELKSYLTSLSQSDQEDALSYYEEYLADAGFANKEEIVAKLGTPKQLSRQIIAQATVDKVENRRNAGEDKVVYHPLKLVWIVLLGLLAVPATFFVAFPLVMAVMAFLVFAVGVALACFFLAVGGLFAAGVCLVVGVTVVTHSLATGFFYIGIGLAIVGFYIFFIPFVIWVVKILFQLVSKASVAVFKWAKARRRA